MNSDGNGLRERHAEAWYRNSTGITSSFPSTIRYVPGGNLDQGDTKNCQKKRRISSTAKILKHTEDGNHSAIELGHTAKRPRLKLSDHTTDRVIMPSAPQTGMSPNTPIIVDDDNGSKDMEDLLRRLIPITHAGSRPRINLEILEGSDDEDEIDQPDTEITSNSDTSQDPIDVESEVILPKRLVDLTIETNTASGKYPVHQYKGAGFTCAVGRSVELQNGDFMRIKSVVRDEYDKTYIRGDHLVRQHSQPLKMPTSPGELVWMQLQSDNSEKCLVEYNPSEVPTTAVKRNRNIIFTNRQYPAVSLKDDGEAFGSPTQDFDFGPLFCRWKRLAIYDGKNRLVNESFQRLQYSDADMQIRHTKKG